MKIVAINALNSNSGGGRSIRDSFLRLLNEHELEERFVVLAPQGAGLDFLINPRIELHELPTLLARGLLAPVVYRFLLRGILSRIGADVVLNLGDLIIDTPAKQIYLFDWPYALDVHEEIWVRMTRADRFMRKVKLGLLRSNFHKADVVLAQTEYVRAKLIEKYALKDVRLLGHADTITTGTQAQNGRVDLPDGVRLVCPSLYYPHKNLEILIEVAALIKARALPYRIVTTVAPSTPAARRFLATIREQDLQNVLVNIGQVPLANMPALYRQCDALLMPTLLESFGIIYPEAMHYGLPILTSDMWFAHTTCGDAAAYFNPFDAEDVLSVIERTFINESVRTALVDAGARRLASLPSWHDGFQTLQGIIAALLSRPASEDGANT